jgi:hypothetical protein
MARPAPGPIPYTLPSLEDSAKLIEHWANAPRMRLGDMSIRQLVESFGDGSPVWLTGSSVWMPAVFLQPPPTDNDIDLIFASASACERFINGVMSELNRRIPGHTFTRGASALGASRILPPTKERPVEEGFNWRRIAAAKESSGLVDAWALQRGESAAEVLMSYKHDYQRCAYLMDRSMTGKAGAITRIVRPVVKSFSSRY